MYSLDRCAAALPKSAAAQICCLSAATQKAFTTVLAGCGLTFTSLAVVTKRHPWFFRPLWGLYKSGQKFSWVNWGAIFTPWSFFTQLINSPLLSPASNSHFPYLFTELWTLPNIILLPPLVAWRHRSIHRKVRIPKMEESCTLKAVPKMGMGTPLHIGLTYLRKRRWVYFDFR